jgi:hypothetical protein
MNKIAVVTATLLLSTGFAWSLPTVDGSIMAGEYSRSLSLLDGSVKVYFQTDASGGLYLAVSATTTGWVGIGLGSVVMDGAHIFMGYVKNGTPVFSEQNGEGHGHRQSMRRSADSFAASEHEGVTTIELHVPVSDVPMVGKKVSFIVAFSGSDDLKTFHDDNHDGGIMDLSADD